MYASFFGFRELPFNNTPDPRFFFSTPDHEEAVATLVYATRERKGFVLLSGEVGTGKTLVTRMMVRHFRSRICFATINHSIDNPLDLMESICTEFEVPFNGNTSPTQLVRKLHDYLLAQFAQNLPVVLILDEAQNLTIEAFEQLRMIGNLEADDAKLLQILIVGQPELQQTFQSPQLRQLRQRLFRSFHLPALDRPHTEQYIRHRLSVVTDQGDAIFDESAFDAIYHVSGGLPRLINTACDNALLSAYSADRKTIDGAFVLSVANQMMLPRASSLDALQDVNPAATLPVRGAALSAIAPQSQPSTSRTEQAAPISELRSGARGSPAGPTPAPAYGNAAAHLGYAAHTGYAAQRSRPSGASIQDVLAQISVIRRRMAFLEQRSKGYSAEYGQLQNVQHGLRPLVREAQSATSRIRTASDALNRREVQLKQLDRNVNQVTRQLQKLLERTGEVTREADRASRRARYAYKTLVDALQRHDDLKLEHGEPPATDAATTRPNGSARILKENSADVTLKTPPVSGDHPSVQHLFQTARSSLADLRDFARHPQRDHHSSAAIHSRATEKLARKVDSLVEMMASEFPPS